MRATPYHCDEFAALVPNRGDAPKRAGKERLVRCPFHDDNNPSLGISDGARGIVAICASCGSVFERLCAMLGVPQAECFWDWRGGVSDGSKRVQSDRAPSDYSGIWPELGPPNFSYDYLAEDGRLLYQQLKWIKDGKKTFRKRRPVGPGRWIKSLKGQALVLYNLPALMSIDLEDDDPVFIVEGEKDVDNLRAIGVLATCNLDGAAREDTWKEEYSQALKSRYCVVIPDNDPPEPRFPKGQGQAHALRVCRSLQRAGARVKLLCLPGLPVKGDVSDWLAAGGTREQLLELAGAAGEWVDDEPEQPDLPVVPTPEPSDWTTIGQLIEKYRGVDLEDETRLWMVRDLIPRETPTLVFGSIKVGKTMTVLDLVIHLAMGEPWLGQLNHFGQTKVLCILEEDPDWLILQRLTYLCRGAGVDPRALDPLIQFSIQKPFFFENQKMVESLQRKCDIVKPGAIVWDNFRHCFMGKENDSDAVSAVGQIWSRFSSTYQAAGLMLHHPVKGSHELKKKPGQSIGELARGSTALAAVSRQNLFIAWDAPEEDEMDRDDGEDDSLPRVIEMQGNFPLRRSRIGYRMMDEHQPSRLIRLVQTEVRGKAEKSERREKVLTRLLTTQPTSVNELLKYLGISSKGGGGGTRGRVLKLLNQLQTEGLVREGIGGIGWFKVGANPT